MTHSEVSEWLLDKQPFWIGSLASWFAKLLISQALNEPLIEECELTAKAVVITRHNGEFLTVDLYRLGSVEEFINILQNPSLH